MTNPTQKTILPSGRAGIKVLACDLKTLASSPPPNFIWDFTIILTYLSTNPCAQEEYNKTCGFAGCAMGYAQVFYSNITDDTDIIEHLSTSDETYNKLWAIFFGAATRYPNKSIETITPLDVATALEQLLSETSSLETPDEETQQ